MRSSARHGALMQGAQAAPLQRRADSKPVAQLDVLDYLKDTGVSALWFLKSVLLDMPKHLWRIVKHLTLGLGVTVFDMGRHLVRAIATGLNGGGWAAVGRHLGALLMEGIAWPLKLLAKILDLVAFGEAMDLVMQIIKGNTRSMNNAEIAAARTVFGNTINYSQVRVDEFSFLNTWLFRFWVAFTTWHTVNWPRGSSFQTDPGTFIHELVHVWQMERRGTQYIAEAPYQGGLSGGGYVYGNSRQSGDQANGTALTNARAQGKTIWDYNLEQQAEICRHFFERSQANQGVGPWQPFINDIQGINTMPLSNWVREPDFLPWA